MLTTFSVEKKELRGIKRLFRFFIKDKLYETYGEYRHLVIRNMKYISYNSKINWNVVYNRAGYQGKCLVCNRDIKFPENSGLERFEDRAFFRKMTNNFALEVLKNTKNPERYKIAFYDIEGIDTGFVEKLCKFTDNFVVITVNKRRYQELGEQLLNSCGVSLVFSDRLARVRGCDMIIAPSHIRKILNLNAKAVILTSQKPYFDMPSQCYYGYSVDIPKEIKNIIPEGMDSGYVASALYSKGRLAYLQDIIPKVAYNEASTCTIKSLAKYMDNLPL